MKYILGILITLTLNSIAYAAATSHGEYYVSVNVLNARLAANKNGRIIKQLHKGQKVEVFEIKGMWARISPLDADTASDGVQNNSAHWVAATYLNNDQPIVNKTKAKNTNININIKSSVSSAIKLSDDFSKYQTVFVSASEKLISSGSCKLIDFKKMGGWWRSLNHEPKPVYVTYCGGNKKDNRIYINAATGETFK